MPRSILAHRFALLLLTASAVALACPGARAADYTEQYERYREAVAAKDLESAVVHARRALLAATRELGPQAEQTGVLAYNLGAVNYQLGRYADAAKALEQAIPVYESVYGPSSEQLTKPLVKLAGSHQELEHWDRAERLYVRASSILIEKRGRKDPEVGLILGQLMQVAAGIDDPKRVRSYGLRSLAALDGTDQGDPIALANIHVTVAGAEMRLGDARQARRHTERAVELYESRYERTDPQMLRIYGFAADVFEQTGKESTARKYRRRIRKAGGLDG